MTDSDILRVPDAAKILNVSEHTIKRHARSGTIPARKIGAFWFFSRTELEAFVLSGQAPKGRDPADQMPRPTLRRARESIAVNLEARRNAA